MRSLSLEARILDVHLRNSGDDGSSEVQVGPVLEERGDVVGSCLEA